MLGALAAFVAALVVTTLVGIPMATKLATVHVWKRPAIPDMPGERTSFERAFFEPVDFGPDLVKWPSEVPRETTSMPEPPWPSAHWDDEHFGRYGDKVPRPAPTRRDDDAAEVRQAEKKPQKQSKKQQQQQKPAQQQQRLESRRPPPAQPAPQQPPPQPAPEAPRQQQRSANALPDAAQVEKMVSELGLAGTVQHLMQTQGWDFKTAAAWLGRARRR